MNQVTICGYLAKDFELSQTKNGVEVAKNFLGITIKRVIVNGNDKLESSHTDWIPIVIFGKRALIAKDYLSKGDKFLGTGRIFTSTYDDEKTGEKKWSWQVIVNNFEFVHSKDKNDDNTKIKESNPQDIPQNFKDIQINEEDTKMIELEKEDLPF